MGERELKEAKTTAHTDPDDVRTGLYLGRISEKMFINYAQKVTFDLAEIRNAGFLMYAFSRDEIEEMAGKHGLVKYELILRRVE